MDFLRGHVGGPHEEAVNSVMPRIGRKPPLHEQGKFNHNRPSLSAALYSVDFLR
jgi:hypothetical protein